MPPSRDLPAFMPFDWLAIGDADERETLMAGIDAAIWRARPEAAFG